MAERKIRFTKASVEEIAPPAKGRIYVYDSETPNLAVCVTSNGSRTYYRCGRVHGQASRIRLGTTKEWSVDKARKAVVKINGEIADGKDPLKLRRALREEMTLGELHDWYMEHHSKPRKRTWQTDERRFNRVFSDWRARRLSTITRSEIVALHNRLKNERGPYAANASLEQLRHYYAKAINELDWQGQNPAAGIERFEEQDRERFLTEDEIPRFFAAVQTLQREASRDFVLLTLFSGARRQNVMSMRWDELDLPNGLWNVPAEKSKNKKPMTIVLPEPALEILRRRHKQFAKVSEWVFPSSGRTGHLVEPKHAWATVLKRAKITNLRIHDLRRTLGSWQAANGASLLVIGKSLGHTSHSATQVYARLDLTSVRASVEKATAAMIAVSKPPAETSRPKKKKKS